MCTVSTEFVMYLDSGCDGTVTVILSYCIWTEPIKLQMRVFQGFIEEKYIAQDVIVVCVFVVKDARSGITVGSHVV